LIDRRSSSVYQSYCLLRQRLYLAPAEVDSLRLEPEESLIGYFFFRTFGVVNSAGIG
jgi:hypothetical protein